METSQYSDEIMKIMRITAFAIIFGACMIQIIGRKDGYARHLLWIVVLIAGVSFYDSILDWGIAVFDQGSKEARDNIGKVIIRVENIDFEKPSIFKEFLFIILHTLLNFFFTCADVLQWISINFFRSFFVTTFKIVAPVVIALGAWKQFEHVLNRFIGYTFALMMWSMGFNIADQVIWSILESFWGTWQQATGTGTVLTLTAFAAATGAIGPGMIGILLQMGVFLFVSMIIFYVLAPITLFAIFSGGNPASAMVGKMIAAANLTSKVGGTIAGGAPSGGAPSGGAPSGGAPSGGAPSGGASISTAGGSNASARISTAVKGATK